MRPPVARRTSRITRVLLHILVLTNLGLFLPGCLRKCEPIEDQVADGRHTDSPNGTSLTEAPISEVSSVGQSPLIPLCPANPKNAESSRHELIITWQLPADTDGNSDVVYLLDGEAVGKGRDGFAALVDRIAASSRARTLVMPQPYFVTGLSGYLPPEEREYWPPYWHYNDVLAELRSVVKDRELSVVSPYPWDRATGVALEPTGSASDE